MQRIEMMSVLMLSRPSSLQRPNPPLADGYIH